VDLLSGFQRAEHSCPACNRLPGLRVLQPTADNQFPGASLRRPLSPHRRRRVCTAAALRCQAGIRCVSRPRIRTIFSFRANPDRGRALGVPLCSLRAHDRSRSP